MAIAIANTSTANGGATKVKTVSWKHTVSGSNRLLLVSVSVREGGESSVESVKANGTALTKLKSQTAGSSVGGFLYYLLNPPTGEVEIEVKLPNERFVAAGARTLTGVKQESPFGEVKGSGATGMTSLAVTGVPSAEGEMVIDSLAGATNAEPTPAAGQTRDYYTRSENATSSNNANLSASHKAGATSVEMKWTFPTMPATLIAVSVKPAAEEPAEPQATTGGATKVTDMRAALAGEVNPNKQATTYWFECGPTTAYGSKTAETSAGEGGEAVSVGAVIESLAANATYHFRLVAKGPKGESKGEDHTLKTLPTLASPVKVYAVMGQSNAEGRGNSSESPTVESGKGFEYVTATGSLKLLADPVGGATSGSAWPAFVNRRYALTGEQSVIVELATGGTNQKTEWAAPNGALYKAAKSAIDAMLASLEEQGVNATFAGVLWDQGENDAQAIDSATETKAEYKTAFEGMLTGLREHFGSTLPVYVFQTGREQAADTTGFQQVRAAQEEVATADEYTYLVFAGAVNFPTEGKMANELHYTQPGYNEMGEVGAEGVVAAEEPAEEEGKAHHLELSDSLKLSASLAKGAAHTAAEVIPLADASTKGASKALADSLPLSDALGKTVGKRLADAVVLADSLAKRFGLDKSDTLAISEALARGVTLSFTDSLPISDAVSVDIGGVSIWVEVPATLSLAGTEALLSFADPMKMLGLSESAQTLALSEPMRSLSLSQRETYLALNLEGNT